MSRPRTLWVALAVLLPVPATAQDSVEATMAAVNAALAEAGEPYRIDRAEFLTLTGEIGRTVFFGDRSKQTEADWVPGDPRRGGHANLVWLSDIVDGTATGVALDETQAAVDRAMATWNGQTCSTIPLTKIGPAPFDVGVVEFLTTGGGAPFVFADVTHAGFGGIPLPMDIIGITFTAVFLDSGIPTDIDGDGKFDTFFAEIYYNNALPWAVNGGPAIDVESIALHEAGHGLSQDHFGVLFQTDANGMFHFAPRAVMNAGYTGPQRRLTGTDKAGHCNLWADWPLQ